MLAKYSKHIGALICITLLVVLINSTQAVSVGLTFPSAASFDRNAGIQIDSDIHDVAFLNILDANADSQSDIFVSNSSGEGGIVIKNGSNYRTFTGIKLPKAPSAQLAVDINNDILVDLISLIPPKLVGSKEWRYAKITNVAADHFSTDAILRKNALMQATIIAPNGRQYQVKENQGSDEPGFIYLSKQLVPEPTNNDPLPDFNTFLAANDYIAYLLPVQQISENYQVVVHKSISESNFESISCFPHIPRDIKTITAMSIGDINNDNNPDLILTTHNSEEMNVVNFPGGSPNYDPATHVATLVMNIPANQINGRDLRGSFFSFVNSPENLFPIRDAGASQITVDFVLPDTGDGFETIKTALTPGDRILITLNDESTKKDLIYLGDGQGCFTLADTVKGNIFESTFGRVTLPGANETSTDPRSVITDPNNNFLPVDSFAGRRIEIGANTYNIEHNDQGHLFIEPAAGNITNTSPDILGAKIFTSYNIQPVSPALAVDPTRITNTVAITVDIPNEIQALVGTFRLSEANPWIRPIDIDQDTDLDLIYIHDHTLFLKTNNEITP